MTAVLTAVISGLCVAVPSIVATILANKRNNDLVNRFEKCWLVSQIMGI